MVIAKRATTKLLSGDPLTTSRKATRIFRKLGPERFEVTPGERYRESWWEIPQDAAGQRPTVQGSPNQEAKGPTPVTLGNPRLGLVRRGESSFSPRVITRRNPLDNFRIRLLFQSF